MVYALAVALVIAGLYQDVLPAQLLLIPAVAWWLGALLLSFMP